MHFCTNKNSVSLYPGHTVTSAFHTLTGGHLTGDRCALCTGQRAVKRHHKKSISLFRLMTMVKDPLFETVSLVTGHFTYP